MDPNLRSGVVGDTTLANYLLSQIRTLFPGDDTLVSEIVVHIPEALADVRRIVSALVEWRDRGFSKLISWQYATFLYKLSRRCIAGHLDVAATDRLFLLNKTLHGLDLHPQIELPEIFFLSHTNAAVFARASYSDYAVFHQSVTIGRKGDARPSMGKYLVMYPGSMIIGGCVVRENTVLAPGVRLIDKDTPGNCYVFDDGRGGVRFREIDHVHAARFFDISRSVDL
jgi:serine O-acetyltransferase